MREQCRDCKFYNAKNGRPMYGWAGFCRRFPPIFEVKDAINDGWPNVHGQSWCGEFKEKSK